MPKSPTIGLITYDFQHLKTEQICLSLLRKGFDKVSLYALPYQYRKRREVLIEHRPDQSIGASASILAKAHGLKIIYCKTDADIQGPEDYWIITGAGLLSDEAIGKKKIINAHPGLIPAVRGLDSFKWAIYEDMPMGVTLHFIDSGVDSGKVFSTIRTPVYQGDSIATLARRHYESEIDVLSDFLLHLSKGMVERLPTRSSHMRMPLAKERELLLMFDNYVNRHQLV